MDSDKEARSSVPEPRSVSQTVANIQPQSSTIRMTFDRAKKTKQVFTIAKSDSSIFPSYTHLSLPFCIICRQRYWKACKDQRKQFISEVATQELLQAKALDGVRVHREFCQYIFSKPSSKEKITLTPLEERRLNKLLMT